MYDRRYTGTEWIEGFFLLAGALWLIGALIIGATAAIGSAQLGSSINSPESNATPIADAPA